MSLQIQQPPSVRRQYLELNYTKWIIPVRAGQLMCAAKIARQKENFPWKPVLYCQPPSCWGALGLTEAWKTVCWGEHGVISPAKKAPSVQKCSRFTQKQHLPLASSLHPLYCEYGLGRYMHRLTSRRDYFIICAQLHFIDISIAFR